MCTPTNDTLHNIQREDRVASLTEQLDRGSGLWHIPAGYHPVHHLGAPCFVPKWEVWHFSMHQEAMDLGSPAMESPPNVEPEGQYSSLPYSVPQGVQQAIIWHLPNQGGLLKVNRSRVGDVAQWETSCSSMCKAPGSIPRTSNKKDPTGMVGNSCGVCLCIS